MKIVKTIYANRYSAIETMSFLKNRLFTVFWRHNTAKDRQAYYEINREVSASVNEMVEVLNAEYRVSREMVKQVDVERLEEMVKHNLANLIAEELIKSDRVIVTLLHNLYGDSVYRVEIPFVKRDLKEDNCVCGETSARNCPVHNERETK